jgi:hypothetical protein
MNDIVKQNIKEKLELALHKEVLTVQRGAELLGITPTQASFIKNPRLWSNVGMKHWESLLQWINSGQTIMEWSQKHGKVLCEKPDVKKMLDSIEIKKETEKRVSESEPVVAVPRKPNSVPKAEVIVPEVNRDENEPWQSY